MASSRSAGRLSAVPRSGPAARTAASHFGSYAPPRLRLRSRPQLGHLFAEERQSAEAMHVPASHTRAHSPRSHGLGATPTGTRSSRERPHADGSLARMGRNVLVVSTVEHPEEILREHLEDADSIKVVVPAVRQGVLDWLANDEKAFARAEQDAERTAERLPGETVDASAGEANVQLAIRDALATFAADEIMVAVRPSDQEGRVESAATGNTPQRSFEGVPVRHVVIPD
jgi:hypothetical protein